MAWRYAPPALGIALLLLSTGTPHGAEVDLNLHDRRSAGFSKGVQSLRERKYANLVVQRFDYSCGAAALATILRYAYGLKVSERQVIEGMLAVSDEEKVRRRGFSLLDIKHYVARLGFRGRGYEVAPEMLRRIKVPTIALVDIRGYQHFVVLRKVAGEHAFIADPAMGNRVVHLDEFIDSWSGVLFAVIGEEYDRHSTLANPDPPLSLRLNRDDYLPPSTVELVEFGFRREELL